MESVRAVSLTLSADGGHARVAYVVEGTAEPEHRVRERTGPALCRASPFLRAQLASSLGLKRTPKLTFTFLGVAAPGSEEGGEE